MFQPNLCLRLAYYRIMLDVCTRSTTDNTDCLINFISKMKFDVLINGYKQILHTIYAPKAYYERIQTFLKEYKPNRKAARTMKFEAYDITGLIKSAFVLGLRDKARLYYWKLFFGTLWKRPRLLGLTISLAAQGFHFRKVYESIKDIKVDDALLTRQQEVLGNELV